MQSGPSAPLDDPTAERLDVGFVPAECPAAEGTGAVHTSTLLVETLSRHHDLTVYVSTQMDAGEVTLPAGDRVEYVLHDDLPKLPHPIATKLDALREETDALNGHDLVHSYSPAFIPVLADLEVPTLTTLNSYLPVCPKSDMLYRGTEKCSGPAAAKCVGCVAATSLRRRQGLEDELRAGYDALGRLGFVGRVMDRCEDVSVYRALSPHIKDDYVDLGFPADRIRIIPHFFEKRFRPEEANRVGDEVGGAVEAANATGDEIHGPGDGPLDLLYVGALRDIKGVDVLVRALPELRERGIDVRLRVVGRGAYEGRLRSLADRLGVDEDVTWLGYIDHDELPAEYRRADLFVYPGRIDEPFGRVMLEALSSGTPVVAADVGSAGYVVGDAGVRFPSENPGALADACALAVENYGDLRAAIPEQIAQFSPEAVLSQLLDLYGRVADGREALPEATSP